MAITSFAATAMSILLVVGGVYLSRSTGQSGSVQAAQTPARSGPAPTTAAATKAAELPGVEAASAAPHSAATTRPTHLTISSLGVSTSLQPLDLLADGSLEPPAHWQEAGWYAKGVVPGHVGPAVIAGHVDSTTGPAIFYRLDEATVGTTVIVTDQNGTALTFVVDRIEKFAKDQFPTKVVYGPTPDPELRLITCTGDFDTQAHSYVDNLVVSAHLE